MRTYPAAADACAAPPAATGPVGIVMLDTQFPRQRGDIGSAASFAAPVLRRVVGGAVPRRVVASERALRESGLAGRFVATVRELADDGAALIVTSCGFLVLLQSELQAAVSVPVHSSSLLLLPGLMRRHAQVGVLTIDATQLGPEHLLDAGVPAERLADVVVHGVNGDSEFAQAILGDRATMDLARACADVVDAAMALQQRCPGLRSLVLECTNMPPYAREIELRTGLRVHSWLGLPGLRERVAPDLAETLS